MYLGSNVISIIFAERYREVPLKNIPSNYIYVRAKLFLELLKSLNLIDKVKLVEPRRATYEELNLFHSKSYINKVKSHYHGRFNNFLDVIGGAITACDAVINHKTKIAWDLGLSDHHAERGDFGVVFPFNCAGTAIEYLIREKNVKKIALINIEAHHAGVLMKSFINYNNVVILDIHSETMHSWRFGIMKPRLNLKSLSKSVRRTKIELELMPATGDDVFIIAIRNLLTTIKQIHNPEVVVLQLGSDLHMSDPMSATNITSKSYRTLGNIITDLFNKVIVLSAGGFDYIAMIRAWIAFLEGLLGIKPIQITPPKFREFFMSLVGAEFPTELHLNPTKDSSRDIEHINSLLENIIYEVKA